MAAIDEEIRALVTEAQERSGAVLKDHEKVLHEVARVLQEKEAVSGDEIRAIVKRIEGVDVVPGCPAAPWRQPQE